MICSNQNQTIKQGDYKSYKIAVTQVGGAPVDITGSTFSLIAKVSATDSDDAAVITSSNSVPTDGPGGLTYVALTHDQTNIDPGTYVYRLKWVDENSNVCTWSPGT